MLDTEVFQNLAFVLSSNLRAYMKLGLKSKISFLMSCQQKGLGIFMYFLWIQIRGDGSNRGYPKQALHKSVDLQKSVDNLEPEKI